MSFYLVKFDGKLYVNDELYYTAVSKGERAFMKALANKTVVGKKLLDQTLFPVDESQLKLCLEYEPIEQDFDDFFKHLNILPKNVLERLQSKPDGMRRTRRIEPQHNPALPDATLIPISARFTPETLKCRQATFFKARDYKQAGKYRMFSKMAAIKICGCIYVAINAVDVRIEKPIVVTLKN